MNSSNFCISLHFATYHFSYLPKIFNVSYVKEYFVLGLMETATGLKIKGLVQDENEKHAKKSSNKNNSGGGRMFGIKRTLNDGPQKLQQSAKVMRQEENLSPAKNDKEGDKQAGEEEVKVEVNVEEGEMKRKV